MGLPILFTLPQNSFNILISVIIEHLLYELNFQIIMGITGVTAYVIKMPSSPTTIFVSFNVRLMDPKPLFEIKCRAYILLFTITASTKYITLQELQCNSPLTKYFLPVTVQVNIFSKTI